MFIQVAPMEGVVDFKVRELLTQIGGVDRTVTEFVRVTNKLLPPKTFYKYAPELLTGSKTKSGVPVYVQLLGSDPQALSENAHLAVELGACGIDLNFGCPAKTVNRHDGGATLLKNPERVFKVVSTIEKCIGNKVPVTAKVRLGFENKELHKDIAQAVDDGGARQLVIHARTRNEGYRPPAHWEYIGYMNDVVKKTSVVANGDIWTVDCYKTCVSVSGVKDIALGRAIMSQPDLALQLKHQKSPMNFYEILNEFVVPLFNFYFEQSHGLAAGRLKQVLKSLSRHSPDANSLFEEIKRETQGIRLKQRLLKELVLTKPSSDPSLQGAVISPSQGGLKHGSC